MLLHASCIALGDQSVLLAGPSGVGKSDLALRFIDQGAELISDDQTLLTIQHGTLCASPPTSLAGLLEVRHMGLMKMPYRSDVPVRLYIDLVASSEDLERLPEADTILCLDHTVPRLRLPSFASSTPAKIRCFLKYPLATDL